MQGVGIIERAYQLAIECGSVDELQRTLRTEGYFQVEAHLRGPQIRGELARRLKQERRTADVIPD
jgi:hypothetical protein